MPKTKLNKLDPALQAKFPQVQRIPKARQAAKYVFYFVTGFSCFFFVIMSIAYLQNPSPKTQEPMLVFGGMSLLFIGISFFLRRAMGESYYMENQEELLFCKGNTAVHIVFEEIQDFYFVLNGVHVYTPQKDAFINLLWFQPLYLLQHLKARVLADDFPAIERREPDYEGWKRYTLDGLEFQVSKLEALKKVGKNK